MQDQLENLKVWQLGMKFVERVYEATKVFPKDEQYGLTGQLRRAAVSIPLNIAEGKGRHHKKEYVQFLFTARGSLYEVLTLIHLSRNLGYLTEEKSQELLKISGEITAMLNGLIHSLD